MPRKTGTDGRDPGVRFRLPPEQLDRLDEIVDEAGWSRSRAIRSSVRLFLETQGEDLEQLGDWRATNDQIVDEGKEAEYILGFPRRVKGHFESRFKSEWSPGALLDSSRSYYRQAEHLEEVAQKHPDIQSVDPGDFVEAVDQELENAIQAMQITDWDERHENPYARFDGVQEGAQARRMALALTVQAMRRDKSLEKLRSSRNLDARVQVRHFPPMAQEADLPDGVTFDDVVQVARRLVDGGVDPEDVELDPLKFDPFGWTSSESLEPARPTSALEDDQAAGPPRLVSADGGDHNAIQAFADSQPDDSPQSGTTVEDAEEDVDDVDQEAEIQEFIERVAERFRDAETYDVSGMKESYLEDQRQKRRRHAEDLVHRRFEDDTDESEIMTGTQLTPERLIELADEYNEERTAALHGKRDDLPETVVDENGGVRLE